MPRPALTPPSCRQPAYRPDPTCCDPPRSVRFWSFALTSGARLSRSPAPPRLLGPMEHSVSLSLFKSDACTCHGRMIGLEHDFLREHQLHCPQQRPLAAVACAAASAPPGAVNPTRQRSALTRPDSQVIEPSSAKRTPDPPCSPACETFNHVA